MKKIILLFLLSTIIAAQNMYRVGFGLNSITPAGNFAELSNTTVGFSFFSEYEIDENIIADVILVLSNFDAKIDKRNLNLSVVKKNIKNSSLMLGIQYKLLPNFFVTLNGGMNYTTLPKEYYQYYNNATETKSKTEAYSIFGPGLNFITHISPIISFTLFSQYLIINGQFSNFNNFSFGSAIFLDLDL